MLAPVTHFSAMIKIRRRHILPGPARLVVRKGQHVNPGDPLAINSLSGRHLIIDLGRGLGLAAADADRAIQHRPGDSVKAGDVLGGPVGLAHRVVRAPQDGRLVWIGEGKIVLELEDQPVALRATIPGSVEDLIPERGAVVVAYGGLLQGVWGNGRMAAGVLHMAAGEPGQPLSAEMLNQDVEGAIVVCGPCWNSAGLSAALDFKVAGLVLSSIDPLLFDLADRAPIPIMLVEGFGSRPMNQVAFQLFSEFEGQQAVFNSQPADWFTGVRPEIIIPLDVEEELYTPPQTELFMPGSRVRVLGAYYGSRVGRLAELTGRVMLPNGLKSESAVILLDGEEAVTLPLANLETLPEI